MINKKVQHITNNVINTINYLHNGMAVPKTNVNNVYNISKYDNSDLIALNIFWNIMKHNNYNNDIRGIIITSNDSKNLENYYHNMVDSIIENDTDYDKFYDYVKVVDSNTYHSKVLLGSTTIKRFQTKTDKTLLYVTNPFSDTETFFNDIDDMIEKIKPNILIFVDGDADPDIIDNIIKNHLDVSIINLVALSKDITISRHDELIKNNNKLKYYLIDVPIYNQNSIQNITDKTDDIQNIVESMILCLNNNDIHKGVVIFDDLNSNITFDIYDFYHKYYTEYDICKNLEPCINLDDIMKINKKDKLIFIGKNDIFDIHSENSQCFDNIDCIINLSQNINDDIIFLINTMIMTYKTGKSLVFVESIDSSGLCDLNGTKGKNKIYQYVANHICNFSNMIHEDNKIEKYYQIMSDISKGSIKIHVDDINIDELYKKIETKLKITNDDKRFMNRNNIGFVITVPKNDDSDIKKFFDEEYKYISKSSANNDDQELYDQFGIIASAKKNIPKYTGGKWISRDDKIEISGNVLCFANETNDKLYACKIIGVKNYTRRDKRGVWKEKDAKGKNILYISKIKKTYKLSDFKTSVKHKGKISYMKEFEYNFDIF